MHRFSTISALLILLGIGPAGTARAETVVLVGGGRLQGEVIERSGNGEAIFLRTPAGGTIGIPRSQIEELVGPSEEERQYRELQEQTPDTPDGHLRLAEWCEKHGLRRYRTGQLRAVLSHDPDHAEARRALGYTRHGKRWMTEEQWMVSRGYVRYEHRWRLPQEISILTRADDRGDLAGQWYRNIKQWYDWATGRDAQHRVEGLQALVQITDPAAMAPMEELLGLNEDPSARLVYLDYLARVGNAAAVERLVVHSMADRSMTVKRRALDHLIESHGDVSVQLYSKALEHVDYTICLTAASQLASIENEAAIAPLISALVSRHQVDPKTGLPLRQTSYRLRRSEKSVFSISPRDIREAISGTGPKKQSLPSLVGAAQGIVERDFPNRAAQEALVRLTGKDYGYDEAAWMQWYSQHLDAQYKPLLEQP